VAALRNPTDAKKAAATVTDPNTVLVAGAFLPADALVGFLPELKNPLSNNVEYIHSKYLLLDPIGDDPIVITGSANFSAASTNRNDENMLVIRGNNAVAEIYFTEFFRLFAHYRFRYILQLQPHQPTPGPETNTEAPVGLDPSDNWWPKYFDEPNRVRQAVWGRNADAARELADRYHATAYDDISGLVANVDGVAFAVPPGVQAPIAIRAARSGKHLLLEKPRPLTPATSTSAAR
jgi:phosphatidylserine/phosphatidylglycerophosphate/cardiolipin synthase-like enzyme